MTTNLRTTDVQHHYGDDCPGGHGATGLIGVNHEDQLTPQDAQARGYTRDHVAAYYAGYAAGFDAAEAGS